MLIDHLVMSILAFIIWSVLSAIVNDKSDLSFWIILGIYLNKDGFINNSLGKSLLGLRVVGIDTNHETNGLKCLIRNLPIILWPLEVLMTLINKERRLGDYFARTKIVETQKIGLVQYFTELKLNMNIVQGLLSALLTVIYLLLLQLVLPI